jgi:hypothetical protein
MKAFLFLFFFIILSALASTKYFNASMEVLIDDSIVDDYMDDFRYKKINKVWIIGIKDYKLEILFKGDKKFEFNSLAQKLPSDKSRYIIYDFDYETDEKPPIKKSRIILILWSPLISNRSERFTYTNSVSKLAVGFPGLSNRFEFRSYEDIDYDVIRRQILIY